jgi:hypothetical protein
LLITFHPVIRSHPHDSTLSNFGQVDGIIPVSTTAWYQKTEATFSDSLALARKHLWDSGFHVGSAWKADFVSLPKQESEFLISCLSAAA